MPELKLSQRLEAEARNVYNNTIWGRPDTTPGEWRAYRDLASELEARCEIAEARLAALFGVEFVGHWKCEWNMNRDHGLAARLPSDAVEVRVNGYDLRDLADEVRARQLGVSVEELPERKVRR